MCRRTMQIVENQTSDKRHLPGDESTTACGASLIVDGKENARWVEDEWLDDFPQDFGDSYLDCQKCAEIADFNE